MCICVASRRRPLFRYSSASHRLQGGLTDGMSHPLVAEPGGLPVVTQEIAARGFARSLSVWPRGWIFVLLLFFLGLAGALLHSSGGDGLGWTQLKGSTRPQYDRLYRRSRQIWGRRRLWDTMG